MRYSPDGKYIACSMGIEVNEGGLNPLEVKLWNAATGRVERKQKGIKPFAFSPDSRLVASYSNDAALIYLEDVLTGETLRTLHCESEYRYGIPSASIAFENMVIKCTGSQSFQILKYIRGSLLQTGKHLELFEFSNDASLGTYYV